MSKVDNTIKALSLIGFCVRVREDADGVIAYKVLFHPHGIDKTLYEVTQSYTPTWFEEHVDPDACVAEAIFHCATKILKAIAEELGER